MKKREIKSKIKKLFEDELADMETQDVEGGEETGEAELSAHELGDSIGVNWEEVDEEQFEKGIESEKEHLETVGGDMEIVAKIALDHLKEIPDYYTKLAEMEGAKEEVPAEEVPAEPVEEPTEEVPAEEEPLEKLDEKSKKQKGPKDPLEVQGASAIAQAKTGKEYLKDKEKEKKNKK